MPMTQSRKIFCQAAEIVSGQYPPQSANLLPQHRLGQAHRHRLHATLQPPVTVVNLRNGLAEIAAD